MILLVCSVESGMGAFSMGRVGEQGSGTWLVQRHLECRCTSRRRVDRTRVRQAGEPDILAATSAWRQARAHKPPGACNAAGLATKTPRASRGVRSATLRMLDYFALEAGAAEDSAFFA